MYNPNNGGDRMRQWQQDSAASFPPPSHEITFSEYGDIATTSNYDPITVINSGTNICIENSTRRSHRDFGNGRHRESDNPPHHRIAFCQPLDLAQYHFQDLDEENWQLKKRWESYGSGTSSLEKRISQDLCTVNSGRDPIPKSLSSRLSTHGQFLAFKTAVKRAASPVDNAKDVGTKFKRHKVSPESNHSFTINSSFCLGSPGFNVSNCGSGTNSFNYKKNQLSSSYHQNVMVESVNLGWHDRNRVSSFLQPRPQCSDVSYFSPPLQDLEENKKGRARSKESICQKANECIYQRTDTNATSPVIKQRSPIERSTRGSHKSSTPAEHNLCSSNFIIKGKSYGPRSEPLTDCHQSIRYQNYANAPDRVSLGPIPCTERSVCENLGLRNGNYEASKNMNGYHIENRHHQTGKSGQYRRIRSYSETPQTIDPGARLIHKTRTVPAETKVLFEQALNCTTQIEANPFVGLKAKVTSRKSLSDSRKHSGRGNNYTREPLTVEAIRMLERTHRSKNENKIVGQWIKRTPWLKDGQYQDGPPEVISITSSDNIRSEKCIVTSGPKNTGINIAQGNTCKGAAIAELRANETKVSASNVAINPGNEETGKFEISPENTHQNYVTQSMFPKALAAVAADLEVGSSDIVSCATDANKKDELDEKKTPVQLAQKDGQLQKIFTEEILRLNEAKRQCKIDEAKIMTKFEKQSEKPGGRHAREEICRGNEQAENTTEAILDRSQQLVFGEAAIDCASVEEDREQKAEVVREAKEKIDSPQLCQSRMEKLKQKKHAVMEKQASGFNAVKPLLPDGHVSKEVETKTSLFTSEAKTKSTISKNNSRSECRASSNQPPTGAQVVTTSLTETLRPSIYCSRKGRRDAEKYPHERFAAQVRPRDGNLHSANLDIVQNNRGKDTPLQAKTHPSSRFEAIPLKSKTVRRRTGPFLADSDTDESDVTLIIGAKEQQQSQCADPSFFSANTSFSSIKSVQSLHPAGPKDFASSVQLVSEFEHERTKELLIQEKEEKIAAKKLALKIKNDHRARLKKAEQLRNAASKNGTALTEQMLEAKIQDFMLKRERNNRRRAESQFQRDSRERFAASHPVMQAMNHSTERKCTVSTGYRAQMENDTISKSKILNVNKIAMREYINVTSKDRGGRFAMAAQKKHVVDLPDDSTESEEDSDTIDEEENMKKNYQGDHNDTTKEKTPCLEILHPNSNQTSLNPLQLKGSISCPRNGSSSSDHQAVMLYMVFQCSAENGTDMERLLLSQFTNLQDANSFARQKALELCPEGGGQTLSMSQNKTFGGEGLFQAQITDSNEQGDDLIYVKPVIKGSSEIHGINCRSLRRRLPEYSWILKRTLVAESTKEDGQSPFRETLTSLVPNFHYSNLVDANYNACQVIIDFLKPIKRPRYEWMEQHENQWCRLLRDQRDKSLDVSVELHVEMDPDEDQLQWLREWKHIEFEVELFRMQGPLN